MSLSNGNILISHPETRFPRYMTDSQSNVVWIGSVKGLFIFGCVCFLFFLLFAFCFPFLCVGHGCISSCSGWQWAESREPAIFKAKSAVSLLHTKTSPKMASLTSKSTPLVRTLLKYSCPTIMAHGVTNLPICLFFYCKSKVSKPM